MRPLQNHERSLESLNDRDVVIYTESLIPGTSDRYYHVSGNLRVDDLEDGLRHVNDQLGEIRATMRNTNAKSNQELQVRLDDINRDIAEYMDKMGKLEFEHRTVLITDGPKIMLNDALRSAVAIVGIEIEAGNIPNRVKVNITTDLLSKGTCLCGTSLDDGSDARIKVEETRSMVSDDIDLDITNDIKIANDQSLKSTDVVIGKIDERVVSINALNKKLTKLRKERSSIKERLKDTGDASYAGIA